MIVPLPGRLDYELHPCNSPSGPAKLFKFDPIKFIASMLISPKFAIPGKYTLQYSQYSANRMGNQDI